jgi:DNA-binding IclR family transcriptional regulator
VYSGGGLSQSEIAEGVGRSKNEIFRMMVVLEERGYIRRVKGDLFRLTDKLGELVGPQNPMSRMLEVARPYMSELSRQTELSNHMWVLKDGTLQVAATTSMSETYSLALAEGVNARIFGSSAGASFLSGIDTEEGRKVVLRESGEQFPQAEYPDFDEEVEACRRNGYCAMPNREANGIIEVSAPLNFGGDAGIVGVLSIPMISRSTAQNDVLAVAESLKTTVAQLVNRLHFLGVYEMEA